MSARPHRLRSAGTDPPQESTSMNVFRRRHDPWWDLEGRGAKRSRIRHKIVADLAFALALVACGLTTAALASHARPVRRRTSASADRPPVFR